MTRTQLSYSDFLAKLKAACEKEGSLRAWARKHGCSAAYVSDVLHRRRAPGKKILAPFKLVAHVETERTLTYHPA